METVIVTAVIAVAAIVISVILYDHNHRRGLALAYLKQLHINSTRAKILRLILDAKKSSVAFDALQTRFDNYSKARIEGLGVTELGKAFSLFPSYRERGMARIDGDLRRFVTYANYHLSKPASETGNLNLLPEVSRYMDEQLEIFEIRISSLERILKWRYLHLLSGLLIHPAWSVFDLLYGTWTVLTKFISSVNKGQSRI